MTDSELLSTTSLSRRRLSAKDINGFPLQPLPDKPPQIESKSSLRLEVRKAMEKVWPRNERFRKLVNTVNKATSQTNTTYGDGYVAALILLEQIKQDGVTEVTQLGDAAIGLIAKCIPLEMARRGLSRQQRIANAIEMAQLTAQSPSIPDSDTPTAQ